MTLHSKLSIIAEVLMLVADSVSELHTSDLYRRLEVLSPEFANRITILISQISPILATTVIHFPFYTRHDSHHGFRVTRRITQVMESACLSDGDPRSLGATELYLLIAASYAHDLGMTVFPSEEDDLLLSIGVAKAPGWETSTVLQQYLRQNHSTRGIEYLRANASSLQIPVNLLSPMDWIMKSHNLSISDLERLLREPFAAEERVTDIRQLAIILCIADSVEFSDTRVIDGVVEKLAGTDNPNLAVSYRENMKHVCIGDSLAIDGDGRVVVSGSFSESDVLSLAHHTLDQMEQWLTGYCEIDRRSAMNRLKVRPEPFARRLELFGARFERLGVRISKKNVINLISSNAVWSASSGAAIKELLQNAIEACRYRDYHSSKADAYSGVVSAHFDRANRVVTVEDNGCGMSERTVLEHLLTVGNSRATEKAYVSAGYSPIARFGIGFWSVFTIAKHAQVETAAFEASGEEQGICFRVELDDLKDYTVFSYRAKEPGTKITLHLKDEIVIDDLFEQSRKQLVCSETNVTFTLDGNKFEVPNRLPEPTKQELFGTRGRVLDEQDLRVFQWVGNTDDTELRLTLVYRMDVSGATFSMSDGSPLTALLGMGLAFGDYSICGFRVPLRGMEMCFDVSRVGRFSVDCKTPKGFEYSLDRTSLIPNGASQELSAVASKLLHDGYRAFLKFTNSYTPKQIFRLNQESRKGGGEIFDVFTADTLRHAASGFADLVAFELRRFSSEKNYVNAPVVHVDIKGLRSLTCTIMCIQGHAVWGTGAAMRFVSAEQMAMVGYAALKADLDGSERAFFAPPSHEFSLLFDGDPDSTVRPIEGGLPVPVLLQEVAIEKVSFDEAPKNILCQVQGRWTGTLYLRKFDTGRKKTYVFLGRHRVLIDRGSELHGYLDSLWEQGRKLKVAETIAMLKDDEEGFTDDAISMLVGSKA